MCNWGFPPLGKQSLDSHTNIKWKLTERNHRSVALFFCPVHVQKCSCSPCGLVWFLNYKSDEISGCIGWDFPLLAKHAMIFRQTPSTSHATERLSSNTTTSIFSYTRTQTSVYSSCEHSLIKLVVWSWYSTFLILNHPIHCNCGETQIVYRCIQMKLGVWNLHML